MSSPEPVPDRDGAPIRLLIADRPATRLGIRMALGAQRSAVYRMILGEAGRLAVVGIGAGLLCSLAATMLIRNLLFDVHAWDASILASVAVALAAAALVASYLPARRATKADPISALRVA